MRRKLSAIFAVAVAMLLSLAIVAPSAVADTGGKPLPTDPRFKYGLKYYYNNIFDASGRNLVDKPPGWSSLPVDPVVNPADSAGSYYLNQVKNARVTPAPGNGALTGKLFLPGEPLPSGAPSGTVVKAPSVLNSTLRGLSGSGLLLRGLGASGFGMGGVTQAPSNIKAIELSQGVAQACIDDAHNCSAGDMGKVFAISNCGHTSTCASIGAKDENGNAITNDGDWFKQNVTPFLNDLWAKLTGQTDQNLPKSDLQQDTTFRGCEKKIQFVYSGNNNGNLAVSIVNATPRPTVSGPNQANWDGKCGGVNATAAPSISPGSYKTICLDKTTGAIAGDYTQGPIGYDWRATTPALNANTIGLCGQLGPDKATLFAVMFYQDWTQAQMDGSSTSWGSLDFSMWVNPDANLDLTESTQATTTVDCTGANGSVFTYSSKVSKVGAFEAPNCPPGFEMTKSNVQNNIGGTTGVPRPGFGTTLDSTALDPAAATKYPLCDQRNGPGCSLSVWVDGTVCRSTRLECVTWIDTQSKSPSRVQCHWGTYTMPTSDCYGIAEGYKSETGMVLDPKTGVWTAIDTYGKPVAPSPQPWNPTNPNPQIGQTPGTTAPPANAPGAFPTTGTQPSTDNCSAPTWSWNPVEFVKNPVVCALKDAFVPKTDIQAQTTALRDKAIKTAPLGWAIAPPIVGPGGGGCPNWVVNVGPVHQNVVCGSSFTGAIVAARGPMFGIVASAMMWPLLRSIWYALIPIVRVSPSGSK